MAFSGAQNTRLGLSAIARSLTGSFTGKVEPVPPANFLGVGVLMYSKDDDYYLHSTPPTITIA